MNIQTLADAPLSFPEWIYEFEMAMVVAFDHRSPAHYYPRRRVQEMYEQGLSILTVLVVVAADIEQ